MPFAAGVRRPLIVLPADAEEWSVAKREAVLIHELGHVRRRDMVGHTLGRIVCALYWFHPLVWTAARRLRDASEHACDDLALRLGVVPSDYAQHLLDIVTKVRNPNTPTAAIAMARRKEFEGRMLAILDPALHRGEPSRVRTVLLSLGLAGFVFAVSAAAPAAREATPQQTAMPPASAELRPMHTGSTTVPATVALDEPKRELLGGTTITREHTVQREQTRQSSRDETVGNEAAQSPDVMQRLIERLGEDSSAEVRRAAAWGLKRYADNSAAQAALAKALTGDADPEVRKMAAWSLAHTRAEPALAALRTGFTGDSDDGVREMAVWGLGTRGNAASAAAISRALGSERSDEVRATAAWALGRLQPDRAPAALVSLLDSSNRETRLVAAWALSEIGDSTALPALQSALDRNPGDAATTRALLRALVRSGSSEASLSRFLSSADPEVRLYAIKSLAGGGNGLDPWPWPRPRPIVSF
jgi:HEAT repeat protein